jgi:hypothetical protein
MLATSKVRGRTFFAGYATCKFMQQVSHATDEMLDAPCKQASHYSSYKNKYVFKPTNYNFSNGYLKTDKFL